MLTTLLVVPARAQRYTFKQYIDGLGNLNVTCLLQDHAGYLWVGTQGGLYRYDGASFQQFGRAEGLQSAYITNLFEDPAGRLWAGAVDHLYYFGPDNKFTPVFSHGNRIRVPEGSTIAALPDHRLAILTRQGILVAPAQRADEAVRAEVLPQADGQAKQLGTPYSLAVLEDGSLLVGCGKGIVHLPVAAMAAAPRPLSGIPEGRWDRFIQDRKTGITWARSLRAVASFDRFGHLLASYPLPERPMQQPAQGLALDQNGRLLVLQGASVLRWENGEWRVFCERNGLDAAVVGSILVDREGSVWLGFLGLGLRRWLGYNQWESFTTANGLRSNIVWAVFRDRTGKLWEGDQSGLSFLLPGTDQFQPWHAATSRIGAVGAITESEDGSLWVASSSGVTRIDERTLRAQEWKIAGGTYSVLVGHDGVIWAGAADGLYTLRSGSRAITAAPVTDPLVRGKMIRNLVVAPDGEIWATTATGPLAFDGKSWRHPLSDFRISRGALYRMAFDSSQRLWLSGVFSGAYRSRWHAGEPPSSESLVSRISAPTMS